MYCVCVVCCVLCVGEALCVCVCVGVCVRVFDVFVRFEMCVVCGVVCCVQRVSGVLQRHHVMYY